MERTYIILGAGATGKACLAHLAALHKIILVDDNLSSDSLIEIIQSYPWCVATSNLTADQCASAHEIVCSPGVDYHKFIPLRYHTKVISDLDLFARENTKPVIGVTGTNGKSTVVTLLGKMLTAAGMKVAVGGNIGTPAVALLANKVDIYILELSSFQLALTKNMAIDTGVVLNISADHLDRHKSMDNYIHAKHKIYAFAHNYQVFNRDDALTVPKQTTVKHISFGVSSNNQEYCSGITGDQWLTVNGFPIIQTSDIGLVGEHNWKNILAALAISSLYSNEYSAMAEVIKDFTGLPHRCQSIVKGNVKWINDSKATNIGSTIACLQGFTHQQEIILILGGQAKQQDFSLLNPYLVDPVSAIIVYGEDAKNIITKLQHSNINYADSLFTAITIADSLANNSVVLFSPGCASFDMFKNYIDRGNRFIEIVSNLQCIN